MSKFLTLFAAVLLSITAFAEEWTDEQTGYTWYYSVSNDKVTINGVSPKEGVDLAIPSEIAGKSVSSIGNNAFYGCSGFTGSLTIPDSVITIGEYAFRDCRGFTGSLTIPDSVTTIGNYAFYGCSGFTGSLTIPDSVITIGYYVFYDCSGFNGRLKIPRHWTHIPKYFVSGCSGITGDLEIPESVTSIGSGAFARCNFTGPLVFPEGVTEIGYAAFRGCSGLTGTLRIPKSVTRLDNCFGGCSGFTGSLAIPDSVTYIGVDTFAGCSGFTGPLTIPDSVVEIGPSAFAGCSGFFGLLTLPNIAIPQRAFDGCNFTAVAFTKGMNSTMLVDDGIFGGGHRLPLSQGAYVARDYAYTCQQVGFPIANIRGFIKENGLQVEICSSCIRESDPTVMDVVYRVKSTKPIVKVRVLAFEDGERSFAKVVRPTTFIDGTAVNVGDGVSANEEHTISWKVSSDWQERLAKFKMDVFAMEEGDGLLPLELTTIPGTDSHPNTVQFSWNYISKDITLEALYWLYADNDLGLTLHNGQLMHGSQTLANGATVNGIGYDALVYIYDKMGYQLLDGDEYAYVKKATRLNLPNKSTRQYAYKVIGK